jgi:hypothetical protein
MQMLQKNKAKNLSSSSLMLLFRGKKHNQILFVPSKDNFHKDPPWFMLGVYPEKLIIVENIVILKHI